MSTSDVRRAAPGGALPPKPSELRVDDSAAVSRYANFCRIVGTPEEMMIDFGLNPQPFEVSAVPIPVTQRIVTNYFTAKRMLHALEMVIQRHETAFGALEVNVQRRVRPGAARQ